MKYQVVIAVLLALLAFGAGSVIAQELIIYPAKGQSQDQLERDKFECYTWAKQQSGFDPMAMPQATAPPPQQEAQKGGVGRGALRGGTVGVVVGAIGGDAKKGAAIGAASGGLIGGMRRRDQKRRQQTAQKQWEQEQANAYMQGRNSYNRAFGACLEGRGYTVK